LTHKNKHKNAHIQAIFYKRGEANAVLRVKERKVKYM
jgi:hypothetical protein